MGSQRPVGYSNDPSTMDELSQTCSDIASDGLDTTSDFSSAKNRLCDISHLLQSTYDTLDKHQCYSRDFEIAFWQEYDKLQRALHVNKILAQRIEKLRRELNYNGEYEGSLKPTNRFLVEGNDFEMLGDGSSTVTLKGDVEGKQEPRVLNSQGIGGIELQKEKRQRNRDKLKKIARAVIFGTK